MIKKETSQQRALGARIMEKNKIIVIIWLVLLAGSIFLGTQYFLMSRQISELQSQVKIQQSNEKIVSFLKLFINIVLKNRTEVSFNDRLKLENAVRDLQDKTILDQWDKFIASQSEPQAQQEVTNLLGLLISKIAYR